MPCIYWEYFNEDNKPVRSKERPEQKEFEEKCKAWQYGKQMNFVWALPAWDYQQETTVVLQLKKNPLIDGLHRLANDEERGDPTKYDIKIIREGTGKTDTKYALTGVPPKELSEEVKEEIKNNPVNVSVLIDNGDPFQENTDDFQF